MNPELNNCDEPKITQKLRKNQNSHVFHMPCVNKLPASEVIVI